MFHDKIKEVIEQPKQALFWSALLGALPFLHWFGVLLMLLITLRKGVREGLILAVVVALLSSIVLRFFVGFSFTEALLQMLNPLGLCLLAWLLRETSSWENVLLGLVIIGVGMVGFLYMFYSSTIQAWASVLVSNLQQLAHEQSSLFNDFGAQDWQKATEILRHFVVGLRVMLTLASAMLTLMATRYLQAALYNPGGLKVELYQLRLRFAWGMIVLAFIAIAVMLKKPFWLSILPVLLFPFICTGLSLLHYFTARSKYQWLILIVFYLLMFTVLPQLLALIILFGASDVPINFRKRFFVKR